MAIRNFCFTINNYTEEDILALESNIFKYVIYGKERGAEGTEHLQGYAELIKRTRFGTIKALLPRAHIERRRGTQEQAIVYCQKDGQITERGEKSQQGARTDLDGVRQCAAECGLRDVSSTYNFQQIRVAEKYLTYNEEPRSWKPNVIWIWGPTGTGKSKMAREMLEGKDIYTKNSASKWWDGYDAHEAVIIDDFRETWFDLTYMLGLIDRYEFQVEFKGGYRQFKPQEIIITSAKSPDDMYKFEDEDNGQLVRRLDAIHYLGIVPDVPEVGG